jgi:hypothetical protein
MTAPRTFTISEVDALIPMLNELVGRQLERHGDIERSLSRLVQVAGGLPSSLDGAPDDTDDVATLKAELRQRIAHYETGWNDVRQLGAVVKDPQIGLLDFYGRIDGKLVWLCWRYGEETLRYYHDLEEGFSGRRVLRRETRERLLN